MTEKLKKKMIQRHKYVGCKYDFEGKTKEQCIERINYFFEESPHKFPKDTDRESLRLKICSDETWQISFLSPETDVEKELIKKKNKENRDKEIKMLMYLKAKYEE